jgi:methenyltetrahydromethanopterin cyclohydrolase
MQPSINKNALVIFNEILDLKEDLGCTVTELSNGTTVVDAGVNTPGSMELGRLVGELCMGGLGVVRLGYTHLSEMTLPAVIIGVDNPSISILGSQLSDWNIKINEFFAIGSGPARALAFANSELYAEIEYKDTSNVGVVALETRVLPSEDVTYHIAERCGISTSDLYCLVVPTASAAGTVQVAARIVETGFFRLYRLGLSPDKIRKAHGTAPIAPLVENNDRAMGRSNDCIHYGGRVHFIIRSDQDDDIAAMMELAPFFASSHYGKSFYDLYKASNFEFYMMDSDIFRPAEITINDIEMIEIHKSGELNPKKLEESLKVTSD